MPSPRKRYPAKPQEEVSEKVSNIFADKNEESPSEDTIVNKIEEPLPVFIEESITPMPDPGPRFLEKELPPAEKPTVKTPGESPPQTPERKHPRNIPKFSRFR